jgi:CelD/BcsL family acetyltransferase involved in cellulose biosynthesis
MVRTGLDFLDARDPRVESIWRSLEAYAPASYFQSWAWIENWLAALPADQTPSLAVLCDEYEPIGAFFLAQRRVRRSLLLQSNALYFNTTGSPRHDELGIEHNRMLALPGARRSLTTILDLLPDGWDELVLPAIDRYAFDDLDAAQTLLADRYQVVVEREAGTPFVDLDAVRTIDGGFDALVPPSTRSILARARALAGPVDVEVATDARQAMAIWGELLRLHARRWAARGMRGAFADSWVERFHRRLILSRLAHGEVQLVRVSSGGKTLGCLYNLVYRGRVLFYQAGFANADDPQLRLGYLCQATAIEHNARAGHTAYELLGGHATYKDNLATGVDRLIWLRVQRPLARFSIEDSARRWYELLVGDRPQLALRPA